jgi:hypothetical protein
MAVLGSTDPAGIGVAAFAALNFRASASIGAIMLTEKAPVPDRIHVGLVGCIILSISSYLKGFLKIQEIFSPSLSNS